MTFMVQGIPKPQGSHKAFMRPGMKHPVVTDDNPGTRPWRQDVRQAAIEHGVTIISGPVDLRCEFILPRPRGHFTGKGALSATGKRRPWPDGKPDLDKCLRLIGDALTGIAFTDDAQVVAIAGTKRWVDPAVPNDVPGALIHVWPADRPKEGPST